MFICMFYLSIGVAYNDQTKKTTDLTHKQIKVFFINLYNNTSQSVDDEYY
jgi:hypothetical protein